MTCQGCVSSIETALKKTAGIATVKVNLKEGNAVIGHDAEKISADQLCEKVNNLGFEASL